MNKIKSNAIPCVNAVDAVLFKLRSYFLYLYIYYVNPSEVKTMQVIILC